jgi:hypothetical protein
MLSLEPDLSMTTTADLLENAVVFDGFASISGAAVTAAGEIDDDEESSEHSDNVSGPDFAELVNVDVV